MTWIYKYENKKYTLEELLRRYDELYEIWDKSIREEYLFWVKDKGYTSLVDIIAEATDNFEESCFEKGYEVIYEYMLDKEFDLNILLKPLISKG